MSGQPGELAVLALALEMADYDRVRQIDQRLFGVQKMAYTTGLFCELDAVGYSHRYCYEHYAEAFSALNAWDGEGHPPGPWIKRKGLGGDLLNPEWSKT